MDSYFSDEKKNFFIYTDRSTMKRINKKSFNSLHTKAMYKNGKLIYCNPLSDENIEKQKEELRRRYCYIYENAPLILAFMVHDCDDERFCDEVKKRLDFDFKEDEICLGRSLKYLSCFELLEDILLGDDSIHKNDLYVTVGKIRDHSNFYKSVKEYFNLDNGNIGPSKFDICMKLIIDSVYSLVKEQSNYRTAVYKKVNTGFVPLNDEDYLRGSSRMILSSELEDKFILLDCYYDILSFRNECGGSKNVINEKGLSFRLSNCTQTLVCCNPFLSGCASRKMELSYGFKSHIYFSLHDELPWMNNGICNSIHDVENGCGTDFFVKEEDIFYKDGKFGVICPCCGSIVKTGIVPGKFKDKIENRIKKRFSDDIFFERKIELLSELTSLTGDSEVKSLVKSKK